MAEVDAGGVSGTRPVRRWCAGILVLALVSLVVSVAGASSAGALDPSLCVGNGMPADAGNPELISYDDGGTYVEGITERWKHSTTWNVPLSVEHSVLDNDRYVPDSFGVVLKERVRAILWSQTSHGTVQLHRDGTWVYTPGVEHPLEGVVESFQYVAYDSAIGVCSSAPATVTFYVDGYTEVVGRAPTAFADRFPSDGSAVAANESLTVPAPGVLANDFNNDVFPYEANSNLVAGVVSQPVWEGTSEPAGTVTEWGVRDLNGVTVVDNSGGFTYTAPATGHGTAVFSYVACYGIRSTTATACSQPQVVRIEVAPTAVARPLTVLLQRWINGVVNAHVTPSDLAANATFNTPARTTFPRFGTPAHGTVEASYFPFDLGEHQVGDFLTAIYTPGPDFPGTDQFTYRLCDTKEDTPTTVCTNESTVTVEEPAAAPKVVSVTVPPPGDADAPLVLHLDRDVKGITAANIRLQERPNAAQVVPVAVELRCSSRMLPGTSPYFCENNFGDTVHLRPVGGWKYGGDYHLRVNIDGGGTGIVAAAGQQVPLESYTHSFRLLRQDHDFVPPVAAPETTTNDDGSITVTWNWSDAGVGVDPSRCPATSTSSGPEPQQLREFCFDLNGNIGQSFVDVEPQVVLPDTTPPVASPTLSPLPAGEWSDSEVTVTWNWSDGDGAGIDPSRCPVSSRSSGEGLMLLSALCTDLAGNIGMGQQQLRVDTTAPTLEPTISSSRVLLGGTATVEPNAGDAHSGLAAASCGPVDSRTVGAKALTCTATDRAGHTTVATVPYTVGVRAGWIARPSSIWSRSGSVTAVVQLTGAGGAPIPDSVARSLPACSVTFTLGDQSPVCAVYLGAGLFGASVNSKERLTPGARVQLTSEVMIDGAELGTSSTSVVVK